MKTNLRIGLVVLLLLGAAGAPSRAATLDKGFGPLSLVRGATPVAGGCGRPTLACTCQQDMGGMAGMTGMAGMGDTTGGGVVDSAKLSGARAADPSPTTLTVTNSGIMAYVINSMNNPVLTLLRGQTYTFNLNASNHPFYIKTIQSTGAANAYTTGVTGSGTQIGTVTFTVPMDAPATLFYDCANHAGMTARIDVIPEPSSSLAVLGALGLAAAAARRRRPAGM